MAKGAYGEIRTNSGAINGDERCFTDYLVLPGGHCEVCILYYWIKFYLKFHINFLVDRIDVYYVSNFQGKKQDLKIVKLFYSLIQYLLCSEYSL